MLVRELQNITNTQLQKAISEVKNHSFLSCYIDPIGGCDITFEGEIPVEQIQKFFSCLGSEELVEYNYDYVYRNSSTSIFTKDNWKY